MLFLIVLNLTVFRAVCDCAFDKRGLGPVSDCALPNGILLLFLTVHCQTGSWCCRLTRTDPLSQGDKATADRHYSAAVPSTPPHWPLSLDSHCPSPSPPQLPLPSPMSRRSTSTCLHGLGGGRWRGGGGRNGRLCPRPPSVGLTKWQQLCALIL